MLFVTSSTILSQERLFCNKDIPVTHFAKYPSTKKNVAKSELTTFIDDKN